MKPLAILITFAALSACVGAPPVSPNATPGAQPADPRFAAQVFNDACVQTLPDFSGTPQAIAAYQMTQHARFGTYYHNQQNLSVKLIGQDCSIVFGVAGDATSAIVAFGTVLNTLAPDPDINVLLDGSKGPDGLFYVNARTTASQ